MTDEPRTDPIPLVCETEDLEASPGEVEYLRTYTYEGDATVRIIGDEDGVEEDTDTRPLGWLNSARITTDPEEDAVHACISVADPRGAFVMTVRRMPDGRMVIHLPHPGEGMPHMKTKVLHDGTLEVVR